MKEQYVHSSLLTKPIEKNKSSCTFQFKCKGALLLPALANADNAFSIHFFQQEPESK